MLKTQTAARGARRSTWFFMAAVVAALAVFAAMGTATLAAGLPVVGSLSPSAGPAGGGNAVVITGSNFTGASDVMVDGVSVPFAVSDATHISIASMPAHAAGSVSISVVSSDDIESDDSGPADNYAYHNAPAVSALSPSSGPAGVLVTLVGSGFLGATSVSFGGVSVGGFSVIDDGHMVVNAPAHSAGAVAVRVSSPGGTSASVEASQFTYDAVTSVTGLSPDSGVVGTPVTIYGAGFNGATSVTFGGVGASFVVVTDNIINAISPAHAAGMVNVHVTSPSGTSSDAAAAQYTYITSTGVSGVSPTSGAVGTVVTIYGSGFTGATSVRFGASFASFVVVNDNVLTATAPAHALGMVDIVVGKSGETSDIVNAGQFTYIALGPTISSLTPGNGASGTMVTIYGSGFTGATSVTFGGSFAAFTILSDGIITAASPTHTLGSSQVVVTTPSGTSVFTAAGNFTFRLNFCPGIPLWVDDLAYGSAGGGFYWDSVSGQVWTAQRSWHLFSQAFPDPFLQPFWVDALTYGSPGGGFYWDSVSGQVWTAQRSWHLYGAQNCVPA